MKVLPKMSKIIIEPRLLHLVEYESLTHLFKRHFSGDWGYRGTYPTTILPHTDFTHLIRSLKDRVTINNRMACDGMVENGTVWSKYIFEGIAIEIATMNWGADNESTECVVVDQTLE